MSTAPKSYSIQELCIDIVGGGTPSTTVSSYWHGNIPWISSADISELGQITVSRFITKEAIENSATNIVPKGTIIIVSRVGVGKAAIAPFDLCFSQDCQGLILRRELITAEFFIRAIQTSLKSLKSKARGATITGVTKEEIKKLRVSIPDIKDQVHISNVLIKAEKLISQRKESMELLDEFLKSSFLKMFGDPVRNEKGWKKVKLREACSKIGSGSTPRGGKNNYHQHGISLIRSLNVYNDKFNLKDLAFIDENQANNLKNVVVQESDVLLNITGASVARCCVVPKNILPARVNQHVAIIRTNPKIINPTFLSRLLTSRSYQQKLIRDARSKGATREAITKEEIETFSVVAPPIVTQQKFEQLVGKIEGLQQKYVLGLQELENLYASFCKSAFQAGFLFKSDTKVLPLYIEEKEEEYFKKRKALACYIINQSLNDEKFGDTKFEKLLFLSDYGAIKRNFGQHYYQKVAGPYDNTFTNTFYIQIENSKLFKRKRGDGQTTFLAEANHIKSFTANDYFSEEELNRVNNLIKIFKNSDYEQPEIIATLYAVWNNRIIRQQQITDELLKEDFLKWDGKKAKYKDRLDAALAWMQKENIVPNGWGRLIEKPKSKN